CEDARVVLVLRPAVLEEEVREALAAALQLVLDLDFLHPLGRAAPERKTRDLGDRELRLGVHPPYQPHSYSFFCVSAPPIVRPQRSSLRRSISSSATSATTACASSSIAFWSDSSVVALSRRRCSNAPPTSFAACSRSCAASMCLPSRRSLLSISSSRFSRYAFQTIPVS